MKKLAKKDFEIRGKRTSGRIIGNAPYIYNVYIKGDMFHPINGSIGWTSKARASGWLGNIIKAFNDGTLIEEKPELYERLKEIADKG